MHNPIVKARRWTTTAGLLMACMIGSLAGCDLDVTNPGAIDDEVLSDTTYIDLMVNGVIGDFQPAYAWTAIFSASFSDELRNHHGYFENVEIDQRAVNAGNATYALSVYNGLHRVRSLSARAAGEMRTLLGAPAEQDVRLAQALAYGAYAYLLLGEQMCSSPIDGGAPVTSEQLLQTAVQRFDEALTVALAAGAATDSVPIQALADSIANLARVGGARASLDLGDMAGAIERASAVTPSYASEADTGFEFQVHFFDQSPSVRRRIGNPYWEFLSDEGERWWSLTGTPFDGIVDPRIPYDPAGTVVFGGTFEHSPNSPASFSTYNGTFTGAPFASTSSIRIASALEAQYIIAEAGGMPDEALESFINSRRAVGQQDPVSGLSHDELMAELREQRSRDFYLDGHRMGDIRRYKALYGINLWPTGPYPGSDTAQYGTQECWPIPNTEATAT